MSDPVNDQALNTIFRSARTHRHWQDRPVTAAQLMAVYDLMRLGPTSSNICPARIVFVVTPEGKQRLGPHLDSGNVEKTMSAPATAIIGYDADFPSQLATLRPDIKDARARYPDARANEIEALRNGSLQGAYFILAARSLGLDCGPMGGFDHDGVDRAFFAGTSVKSNFLCNIGHGDAARLHPRQPRLSFDQACSLA